MTGKRTVCVEHSVDAHSYLMHPHPLGVPVSSLATLESTPESKEGVRQELPAAVAITIPPRPRDVLEEVNRRLASAMFDLSQQNLTCDLALVSSCVAGIGGLVYAWHIGNTSYIWWILAVVVNLGLQAVIIWIIMYLSRPFKELINLPFAITLTRTTEGSFALVRRYYTPQSWFMRLSVLFFIVSYEVVTTLAVDLLWRCPIMSFTWILHATCTFIWCIERHKSERSRLVYIQHELFTSFFHSSFTALGPVETPHASQEKITLASQQVLTSMLWHCSCCAPREWAVSL